MALTTQSQLGLSSARLPNSTNTRSSYLQILKSSAIVGGSSVLVIALGIVRTKVLALLLGPSGVGLVGLFNSIVDFARNLTGMGICSSGIRQIADSVASNDTGQITRTVCTLRRVTYLVGFLGFFLVLLLRNRISQLTFGNEQYSSTIALLSVAVLLGTISSGQLALVQGMRRIGDLSRSKILGATCGTLCSIPIFYYFRERGIALYILVIAATAFLTSWWYSRKVKLEVANCSWTAIFSEAAPLLKLGIAFMASGLMSVGTMYFIRVFVARRLGIDAAGFYQAAWTLSGIYVGFILEAMGADFFPRLTAVAKDNITCNRFVNEQTEVGLLIAVPGVLATLTCAPLIIRGFYSSEFEPAIKLLQWNCMGMLFRVISWPLGFIILAKGERLTFIITESLTNLTYILLIWGGVSLFGLIGTGVAFLGMYLFCLLLVNTVAWRLSGFRWSATNIRLASISFPLVAIVFIACLILPLKCSIPLAIGCTLWTATISLKRLSALLTDQQVPKFLRTFFRSVGTNKFFQRLHSRSMPK